MIILGFNIGSTNIISLSLFSFGYFIINPLLTLCRTGFSIELLCNILGHQMSINWRIGYLLHDK
jgi:hypothetical protein